jgi:catechol 2,3-dioxygenase-like lactoylglutathione lyase family enzyme
VSGASIDHVVMAVRDLDDAAARLTERTGLATVAGGRHERWGTENRIVPLGDDYLELLAVVDPEVGATTPLGRALMSACQDGDAWFSICVAVPDIEATGARLALTVEAGSRMRPDGVEVRWRGAGIDDPARPSWLPFFIAWDVAPELHPARAMAAHAVTPLGIVGVEVGGSPGAMRDWLDGAKLPIHVWEDGGAPGVRNVAVGLADGRILRITAT